MVQAQSLHRELVSAISQGQSLDNDLPDGILHSYPKALTTKAVRLTSTEGHVVHLALSYNEAIARTEDVMKNAGLRVKVAIQASGGKCNIKYRPVIGGAELDAGQTDLSADVDPRWYIFSCDCKAPPIEKRVDCSQNATIVFPCQ